MKYCITFFIILFFAACEEPVDTEDRSLMVPPAPAVKLTPLQTSADSALRKIITRDIELSGAVIKTIQITGMEVIKISKKDYYAYEMEQQEINFKSYMQYLAKFEKTNSPLNDPAKLQDSKKKHNAVMAYLKKVISTASTDAEVYKVIYYLNAEAGNMKYNQTKTTFLDKEFKKMEMDYSFLK